MIRPLDWQPGRYERFVLHEEQGKPSLVLSVGLLSVYNDTSGVAHYWWDINLARGYLLYCDLRTFDHTLALPLLLAVLCMTEHDDEECAKAKKVLEDVFGDFSKAKGE